ncbi:hypothetical protein LTR53_004089 [Teratosphaeriaceae sp. CCFEE 6253]|nr:hypothetical protein LTR53_004089 [Teratosphaeriaceae sp. CCFEE 6253]
MARPTQPTVWSVWLLPLIIALAFACSITSSNDTTIVKPCDRRCYAASENDAQCTLANNASAYRAPQTPSSGTPAIQDGKSLRRIYTSSLCIVSTSDDALYAFDQSSPLDIPNETNSISSIDLRSLSSRTDSRHRRGSSQRKSRRQKQDLRRRDYFCHECDEDFLDAKGLKAHYHNVHDQERVILCDHPDCADLTPSVRPYKFRNHLRVCHNGKGFANNDGPKPKRRITKFARGCGICLEVFETLAGMLGHHVQHCKARSKRQHWHVLIQVISLLRQKAVRELWNNMLGHLGGRVDVFIHWCLRQRRDLVRLLEGDPLTQDWAEHRDGLHIMLRTLFAAFQGVDLPNLTSIASLSIQARRGITPLQLAWNDHSTLAPIPPNAASGPSIHGEALQHNAFGTSRPFPGDTPQESFFPARNSHADPSGNQSGRSAEQSYGATPYTTEHAMELDVTASLTARQSLLDTISRGLFPTSTDGSDLLCGIHAIVGSMNAVLERPHQPFTVSEVMETLFTDSQVTPAYALFLDEHLTATMGTVRHSPDYWARWDELTARDNIGADQLAILPRFLRRQGIIDREVVIGVLTAGSHGTPVSAYVHGEVGADVVVAWLHNDNARRLVVGARYNHWTMFAERGDLRYLLDGTGFLPAMAYGQRAVEQPSPQAPGIHRDDEVPSHRPEQGEVEVLDSRADHPVYRQPENYLDPQEYTADDLMDPPQQHPAPIHHDMLEALAEPHHHEPGQLALPFLPYHGDCTDASLAPGPSSNGVFIYGAHLDTSDGGAGSTPLLPDDFTEYVDWSGGEERWPQ